MGRFWPLLPVRRRRLRSGRRRGAGPGSGALAWLPGGVLVSGSCPWACLGRRWLVRWDVGCRRDACQTSADMLGVRVLTAETAARLGHRFWRPVGLGGRALMGGAGAVCNAIVATGVGCAGGWETMAWCADLGGSGGLGS